MTFINIRDTSGRQSSLQATKEGTLRVTGVLSHGTELNPNSLDDAKKLITYLENWVRNRQELPVIFRKSEGRVIAVFPTWSGTSYSHTCTCYTQAGMHSVCARNWYQKTQRVRPEEYASLLAELTAKYVDYNLVVRQRWVTRYDNLRLQELNK